VPPPKRWIYFLWAIRVQTAGEGVLALVALVASAYITAIIAGGFMIANTILLVWLQRGQRKRELEWEYEYERRRQEDLAKIEAAKQPKPRPRRRPAT
jgi:hypothetical protein